jgi:acetoin utilization deacetylase AcuC-like enzyme
MTVALISHADCRKHDMGAHHPETPRRLDAIFDHLRATSLLDYVNEIDAPLALDEHIALAHTSAHIAAMKAASPHDGYRAIDGDTAMNQHTLMAAYRAAGAVTAGVNFVMQAKGNRAFCAVRPPGHHAERDRAMGFCFFNNAAIAVRYACAHYGLERVALVDFDVHHGNGSENILANDSKVLMLSTFQTNLYPYSGDEPLGSNMRNVGLPAYSRGDAMQAAVEAVWKPALAAFKPQLLVISAGFDAHREDELAMLGWTERDYAWISNELVCLANTYCDGRIVSTLEGGYALEALSRSVAEHLKALLEI